jgi:DNA topoisomerase III
MLLVAGCRDGGHDDQAHPPIHPTKSVPLDSLDGDKERELYELVTRHFIACCSRVSQLIA